MTEKKVVGTDELASRMCRESDAAGGARTWIMHLTVLVVLVMGVALTVSGIRDLREATIRREAELLEFRAMAARASRSPRRDAKTMSAELTRRIANQGWHENLDGVRPRVLRTAAGLRVRFATRLPNLDGGGGR